MPAWPMGGLGLPVRNGGRSDMTLDGTAPLDAVPMSDIISADYRPSEDEPYMNARQSEYFRRKLLRWRDDILRGSDVTLRQLKEEDMRLPDQSDWASAEIQRSFELRTRDRERKLLSKIDAALEADRGRQLRLLRGDAGADRHQAPRGPADRHARASRRRSATSAASAPTARTDGAESGEKVPGRICRAGAFSAG